MTPSHLTTRLSSCTRSFSIALAVTALLGPLGVAGAQVTVDSVLRVGTRVRVATVNPDSAIGSRRAVGVVQSRTGDSMTVAWENGLRSTLTNAQISQIDVSVGPKPYVLRGMGIGLLSGAVLGGVIGAASYEPSAFLDFGIEVEIAAHAIIFGAAGSLVGGVVGAVGRREGWSRVQMPRLAQRVTVAPYYAARARGVKLMVRF